MIELGGPPGTDSICGGDSTGAAGLDGAAVVAAGSACIGVSIIGGIGPRHPAPGRTGADVGGACARNGGAAHPSTGTATTTERNSIRMP